MTKPSIKAAWRRAALDTRLSPGKRLRALKACRHSLATLRQLIRDPHPVIHFTALELLELEETRRELTREV
jgi:hypothetical protein